MLNDVKLHDSEKNVIFFTPRKIYDLNESTRYLFVIRRQALLRVT